MEGQKKQRRKQEEQDKDAVEVEINGLLNMASLFERANSETDDDTVPPPPPGGKKGFGFFSNYGRRVRDPDDQGDDDDGKKPTDEEGRGRKMRMIVMMLCLALIFAAIGLSIALTKGKGRNGKSGRGTPSTIEADPETNSTATADGNVNGTSTSTGPQGCGEVLTVDTTCFAPVGGSIEIFFTECGELENGDWIGLYPAGAFDENNLTGLGDEYILWVYACDDDVCQASMVIEFSAGSIVPLGTYRIVYFKNSQELPPYTASSYSGLVTVSENCATRK